MAIINGTSAGDNIQGTGDADVINAGGGSDNVVAGAGDDVVNGGANRDRIDGGEGNDTINGEGSNDKLIGGTGDDTINGGAGDDRLYGGEDADILIGGDGNDVLYGGNGGQRIGDSAADEFWFDNDDGSDKVYDFEVGLDKVVLTDGGSYSLSYSKGDTIMTYGDTSVIFYDETLTSADIVGASEIL